MSSLGSVQSLKKDGLKIHGVSIKRSSFIKEKLIESFHPIWFVSPMGTGISSCVLYRFPFESEVLQVCSYIMFSVCLFLFIQNTILFILQMIFYPNKRYPTLFDISRACFLGCYPMGLSSIVNMTYLLTVNNNSKWSWTLVYVLWWISGFLSLATAWFVTFCIQWKEKIYNENLHATLLLPVVSLTVSGASGALITNKLPIVLQPVNLIICYLLWANAILLAFLIIAVHFWKLYVHKIPKSDLRFSSFLPIGLFGQGAYGIMLLGNNTYNYIKSNNFDYLLNDFSTINIVSEIFLYFGLISSLFLISNGICFTILASFTCLSNGKCKFSRTWWAMTFPLGTMSLATTEIYRVFEWTSFRWIGTIYGSALIIITIICLIGSIIWEFPHEIYLNPHNDLMDNLENQNSLSSSIV
ncbi:Ssu1p ASCRUDRAFT_34183 [Ascoidea rubescens DSM 1968]|uniref:C4-dicarboxylate transporter/malic acid transport protein n=1 Tax=Ascoidea rubescens DSM 1968 TaxID=1344418 RepID=A0A1D2VJ66_9ASCO|nr:hypothetical protein ASCRUDRAFT_34183 [Ascoidea rubescens DSM 1968]ODV61658.1 hypothetical protein ASCRUDRAFT_34183 [Ascoidea rubescens DSM 1968]